MGEQSSRLIWGKDKTDGNEPTPVAIYDPNTIYTNGNFCIHADGRGTVAEDYHLYLCTAEESGGDFTPEEWKLQEGVKNYYLIARRSFKKGARVIKEDHNGDFQSLKLYKCIADQTTPNMWVPAEWEVVYQDVGIAWAPRDHKDIYYDDGRNEMKWHWLMYYVPNDYDYKTECEIGMFNESIEYHYGDRVLHEHPVQGLRLYKFIRNIPYEGPWASGFWEEETDVNEYEANVPYQKGDEVIKLYTEEGFQEILEYSYSMIYNIGNYCIHQIDRQHDKTRFVPFDLEYLERIYAGEELYGLYKCISKTTGNFDYNCWELQVDEEIQIRGVTYNEIRHTIKQYTYGKEYSVGEIVIWKFSNDSDEFSIMECIQNLTGMPARIRTNAPPNETYWQKPRMQYIQASDINRIYAAITNMTAAQNTHFDHSKWKVQTQECEPDFGDYGVVWQKYPGATGGGMPFLSPLIIFSSHITDYTYLRHSFKNCFDCFVPSVDINQAKLQINRAFVGRSTEAEISDNFVIFNGANLLLKCGFIYIGIWVSDNIDSLRPSSRDDGTVIFKSKHILTSYDTSDFDFLETTELQNLRIKNGSFGTVIPFMDGYSGVLYFAENNGDICIRKASISITAKSITSDTLLYTIDSSNNYDILSKFSSCMFGGYNTYNIYNHFFYERNFKTPSINLLTFELEDDLMNCTLLYSRNSYNTEHLLGCRLYGLGDYYWYSKLLELDPDSIFNLIYNDVQFTNTTYQYNQYDSPLSPSEAAYNIALIGNLYNMPYTNDTITPKFVDGNLAWRIRCLTTPDATNDTLYQIEELKGIYKSLNDDNIAVRIMQLRKHNRLSGTSIITIADQRINIGSSQSWPSDFDQDYSTYPWFDISDLYYINMTYAYFMEHNDTSDNYGYWKLNLDDGTFRKLPNIGLTFGRINNIKPYKNLSIFLENAGNVYVNNLNLIFCKSLTSGETIGLDTENHEINLYVDPTYYINAAYGATVTGNPVGSINTSLIICDTIELSNTPYAGEYGIVIYIPQFNGDNIEEANAFFFLNSETDNGGPFFGGASTPGF